MKLSNLNVKGIAAAAVLAGTMAFAPVSALAGTVPDTNVVNKTWTVASNSQFNNDEVFQFNLKYAGVDPQGTNETQDFKNFDKTVGLDAKWLDLANGGTSASAKMSAKKLFGDTEFTKPGTYKFTLTEVPGTNPNIDYSNASYTVTVTVAWSENYPAEKVAEVKSVTVRDASGKKTDSNFQNTAHANDSLKVSKTVAGTAANTNDKFSYTLTIDGAKGSYDVVDQDGKALAKVEAGTDYKFTLKHGQSIEVKNLPEGATYKVTEAETAYDEANTVNGTASKDGHIAEGTVAKQNDVQYKNTRGFAADTGITMNTIPAVVAGGVVVAGAVTLVISRRRRSSEEF